MPRLQTQLTGLESSRFRRSHILKYLPVHSPLSALRGISSLVPRGQGPVEAAGTLREEKMSQMIFSSVAAFLAHSNSCYTLKEDITFAP